MVNIIISGDGTYNKLSQEELKDISQYICNKNKDFHKVNICYKEEDENITTHEKVFEYCHDLNEDEKEKCICGISIDSLGKVTVTLEFKQDDKYIWLTHYFMTWDSLKEKELNEKTLYDVWSKQGYVTLFEGSIVNYFDIIEYIIKQSEKYNIKEIRYDPWNAVKLARELIKAGFKCIEVRNTYKTLFNSIVDINRLLLEDKLVRDNNPILNLFLTKYASNKELLYSTSIDGFKSLKEIKPMISGVMAHDLNI